MKVPLPEQRSNTQASRHAVGQLAEVGGLVVGDERSDAEFDPRMAAIPRGPVFGTATLSRAQEAAWDRVDQQGACRFTTSGRAAILLALRAAGVGPGDRVLLPSYHCPTMVEPAVRLGADPVFYPIRSDGGPDLEFLRRAETSRVRALLAAHFFGLPQDLTGVRAFCDLHKILLIEDCAHAFFGRSRSGPVGSAGDMAIGSLMKFFPVTEGGCLIVRSNALTLPELVAPSLMSEIRTAWDMLELGAAADRLGAVGRLICAVARLKNWLRGRGAQQWRPVLSDPDPVLAFNSIDPAQVGVRATAVVRQVAMRADSERIAIARRANYMLFAALLQKQSGMRPLFPRLPEGAVPYVFPLEVDDPGVLYPALRRRGVPLYRWDILWPGTPCLPEDAGRSWSTDVFQLACHQDMSAADIRAVASVISEEVRAGG